jgi:3-dehydroquinate synthase
MKRPLVLVLAVAGLVIGSKLLVEDVLGIDLEPAVSAWLADAGVGSAAIIVGLLAADVFLPVPSSVIMVLSGAAFGVLWGSLFALVGSVLGEWVGFELVRRFGRRASSRVSGDDELEEVNRFFERYGALAVIVTRPLPVVMETMSLVAGLSQMPRRVFLTASIVGTAPIVLIYAYAGAISREVGSLLPAVVILVGVVAAAWLWYRSRRVTSAAFDLGESPANRQARL